MSEKLDLLMIQLLSRLKSDTLATALLNAIDIEYKNKIKKLIKEVKHNANEKGNN